MTSAPENQPVGSASRRTGAWGGKGADGFQPPGAAQTLPMPAAGPGLQIQTRPALPGYAAHALGSLK
jgi:hypothetical protein